MSVIEASSVGVKTMADGTLRITLDIEPRHSKDAFNLFGAPGTPCALAALKCATQEPATASSGSHDPGCTTPDVAHLSPKGGALAKLAGMWCNDQSFLDWINVPTDSHAADWIRATCRVQSRAELDSNAEAAELFQDHIRGPYMKHQLARGMTT